MKNVIHGFEEIRLDPDSKYAWKRSFLAVKVNIMKIEFVRIKMKSTIEPLSSSGNLFDWLMNKL